MGVCSVIFFFKQKTAYEMRISDWSSDVCSSDLEVLFPNAIAFDNNMSVGDYINRAGGFTNNANGARLIVKRQDGRFARAEDDTRMMQFGSKQSPIQQGDELLVLPKIDVNSRKMLQEKTQIIYQIGESAGGGLGP